jgi:dihydroorotate dehydrogenase
VVFKQAAFGLEEQSHLQFLREKTDMIVISRGPSVSTAAQIIERVKSGAHLVQVSDPLFLEGPFALSDLKAKLRQEY